MNNIEIFTLVIAALFGVKLLKDSASLLWLLQTKEYRLDRLRSHWRENARINLGDLDMALGILIMLAVLFPETFEFLLVSLALILGALAPWYFLGSFLNLIRGILHRAVKRPRPTTKMLLIAGVYALSYALFALALSAHLAGSMRIIFSIDFLLLFGAYLLFLNALAPVFILLAALLVTPIAERQKHKIVRDARFKMAGFKHVKTIGITGSYGKTSTKEFLYGILSQKYKVVKTSGNNNTLMGVAGTILREVSDDHDFFICEMGAYKRGEIAEISELARPYGAIVTGINEQHLDLFGSIENTKRGKFELLENLPEGGFAVVNEKAQALPPQIPIKAGDISLVSGSSATDIVVNPDSIAFEYQGVSFKANLLGRHYVDNLLLAITMAEKLGMSLEEISAAVAGLDTSGSYLMRRLEGPRGSVFIDDSYTANRSGVLAALEYLREAYPDKNRILVFPGIIELGNGSERVHGELWDKTDAVCQSAYLLLKPDKAITAKRQRCQFIFEKDFDKMKDMIAKRLDQESVVLFENRGAGVIMRKILAVRKTDA